MTYAGGYWRDKEGCSIEAYARFARQREWKQRGATDRRAGLPLEDAFKVKAKSYRRAWRQGWKEEDALIRGGE